MGCTNSPTSSAIHKQKTNTPSHDLSPFETVASSHRQQLGSITEMHNHSNNLPSQFHNVPSIAAKVYMSQPPQDNGEGSVIRRKTTFGEKDQSTDIRLFEDVKKSLYSKQVRLPKTETEEQKASSQLKRHRQYVVNMPIHARQLSKIPEVNSQSNSRMTIHGPGELYVSASRLATSSIDNGKSSYNAAGEVVRSGIGFPVSMSNLNLQVEQGIAPTDYSYAPMVLPTVQSSQ